MELQLVELKDMMLDFRMVMKLDWLMADLSVILKDHW